jgi:hypothetical protein
MLHFLELKFSQAHRERGLYEAVCLDDFPGYDRVIGVVVVIGLTHDMAPYKLLETKDTCEEEENDCRDPEVEAESPFFYQNFGKCALGNHRSKDLDQYIFG